MANAKILIVDDSLFICRLLDSRLRANDYTVISAMNGEEALQKAHKELPDLMLLDVAMPKMDGFELASRLRADVVTKDIPIIMVTARGGQKDKDRAFSELGVQGYIVKPFTPEILLSAIEKVLPKEETGEIQ